MKGGGAGSDNVCLGVSPLLNGCESSQNVAIGTAVLQSGSWADGGVYIGYHSGINGCTGAYNTCIGYNSLQSPSGFTNVSCLGYSTTVTASNQVQLGNSSTTTYCYGSVQDRSDLRDKTDVQDTKLGLDFINQLRPVQFRWDYRDDYNKSDNSVDFNNLVHDGSKKRNRLHCGLIAQEVKQVMKDIDQDWAGLQWHAFNGEGKDCFTIGYQELFGPMIKAIQELTARVDALEHR
jgi:trimeric autotransporter adhesin